MSNAELNNQTPDKFLKIFDSEFDINYFSHFTNYDSNLNNFFDEYDPMKAVLKRRLLEIEFISNLNGKNKFCFDNYFDINIKKIFDDKEDKSLDDIDCDVFYDSLLSLQSSFDIDFLNIKNKNNKSYINHFFNKDNINYSKFFIKNIKYYNKKLNPNLFVLLSICANYYFHNNNDELSLKFKFGLKYIVKYSNFFNKFFLNSECKNNKLGISSEIYLRIKGDEQNDLICFISFLKSIENVIKNELQGKLKIINHHDIHFKKNIELDNLINEIINSINLDDEDKKYYINKITDIQSDKLNLNLEKSDKLIKQLLRII